MMESLVRETFYFARMPSLVWFVPLCLGAAALIVLYWRRAHPQAGTGMGLVLTGLRTLLFALLLVYLFQPTLLRQTLQQIPPEVAVLVDTSGSMAAKEDGEARSAAIGPLLAEEDAPLRRALRPAGKVRYFTFDREVRPTGLEPLTREIKTRG